MTEVDDIIKKISPHYQKNSPPRGSATQLEYDSPSESLEPVYFWILDYQTKKGFTNEKLIDNFASSPGSGHFSELGMKKSQMQEQASKLMATINQILRSVLNLIYDLKEFKIRLDHYDAAKSKDKNMANAGLLSLKQIWMDKVDMQRGQGSINAMSSGNLQFVTLRDAFLTANSPKDVDRLDLNDRVKRVLKARIQEFVEWRKRSEQELRKRFEIEKTYLKSQVDALKLQSRWAKPYLKAAERLEQSQNLEADAALVTAFNTILLQLTLMSTAPIKTADATLSSAPTSKSYQSGRVLPEDFKKVLKKTRNFYAVVVVDFKFIGIPSKVGQQYVFGGKATVDFKGYALHEEELDLLRHKLDESDLASALKLVQGMTEESLEQLQIDIDEFLKDEEEKPESVDTNPFTALFSSFKPKKKEKDDKKSKLAKLKRLDKKGIKPDSYAEKYVRNLTTVTAMDEAFDLYDKYKKGHGMASVPYGGEKGDIMGVRAPSSKIDNAFGF